MAPAHDATLEKGASLRSGPDLTFHPLHESIAVLVALLVLADLLDLLAGKAIYPLRDLVNGQLVVVRGLQGGVDNSPKLYLAGYPLRLLNGLLALLRGLFGEPQPFPSCLTSSLHALPRGLLGDPQTFPNVGEGREEGPINAGPTFDQLAETFLLLLDALGEYLNRAPVVLGCCRIIPMPSLIQFWAKPALRCWVCSSLRPLVHHC